MPKRALLIGLKLAVSAGLLAWLWSSFDGPAAFRTIGAMTAWLAVLAFGILLLHGVLSAWRWRTIVRLQGGELAWRQALRLFFIAMFFNQTLSTTIAGDAARVLMLRGGGMSAGQVAVGVLLERAAGLLALAPLIVAGFAVLSTPADPFLWALLIVAAGLPVLLLALARLQGSESRWIDAVGTFGATARRVLLSTGGLGVLGQSILVHLGAGLAAFLLAAAAGASPGLWVCLALTPPVLLLATLPISFGGWGPREGGLIWLFGLYGVPADAALAVSVALGLLVMAAGLPGGALWLSRSTRTPPKG